jgi:putative heme-binding domain-containing protein
MPFPRFSVARRNVCCYWLALLVILLVFLGPPVTWAQRDLQRIPDPNPDVSLASFTLPEGLQANLFAGDGQINKPIHMNFDARGRLWVAGSEVYPQIEPGQPATDKIYILEDTNGDGSADSVIIFADDLLIPTGILPDERGGCYVANSTELLYLWDSDGDGKADQRRIVLSGFGTEDTHHLLHTLAWAPDGSLFMNQSIYIHSHVETPWGVRRMNGGGVWRFRPDTMELEVHCLGFVNPWGKIFDDWGQSFATDGAYGEGINYVFPNSVFVTSPGATRIVGGMNPGSPKHCGLEMVSGRHFPSSWQGHMITNDFRANRVCRFEVEPVGSSYRSRQLEEVIRSTHQAFRPIDAKMGADGALYIADWYNPIIQHGEVDFRDPRRDRERGRIWRLSFPDRDLVRRDDLASLSPAQLLEQLRLPEQSTRVWAKRMLRRHEKSSVQAALQAAKAATLAAMPLAAEEQAYATQQRYLLELLWAGLTIDVLDHDLLRVLLDSNSAPTRAAAVRVASDFLWRVDPSSLRAILFRAVDDEHAQVRLEAVTAWRRLPQADSATAALRILQRPLDASLDFALWKTLRDLSSTWLPLAEQGKFDFGNDPSALTYAFKAVESSDVVRPLLQLLGSGQVEVGSVPAVVGQIAALADASQLDALLTWVEQQAPEQRLDLVLRASLESKAVPSSIPRILTERLSGLAEAAADQELPLARARQLLRAAAKWPAESTRAALWNLLDSAALLPPELLDSVIESVGDTLVSGDAEALAAERQRFQALLERAAEGTMLRAALIGQWPRWDVAGAVPGIATELAQVTQPQALAKLLTPLLEQRAGQAALAAHLQKAAVALSPEVAREALRLQRSSPAPDLALATALRTVGNLSEAGWRFSPAEQAAFVQRIVQEGDPVAGERIYRRSDLQCLNCHAIGGIGSIVGPDMISIGASAPVDYLLESLVDPAAKVKEGYHTKKILMQDGTIVTGMVQSQAGGIYRLRLADGSLREIAESDIDEIADGSSLMPNGLVDSLTAEELIHLTSFLSNLGRTEAFSIRTADIARAWQVLGWDQATHQLLNRTSFDSAADGRTDLPWQALLPMVSGSVPVEELASYKIHANVPPTSFVRTKLLVHEAGPVELRLSSINGLQFWLNGKPTRLTDAVVRTELTSGTWEMVFAIDRQQVLTDFKLEIGRPGDSPARWTLPLVVD